MTTVAPAPAGESLFIDGRWRSAAAAFRATDPADPRRETGAYSAATAADVADAYAAAAKAQPEWAATPAPERAEFLRQAAAAVEAAAEDLALAMTADMGKTIRDARAEALRAASIFRYFAGEVLQSAGEVYPSADPATTLLTLSEPVGVVLAITPWNFPVAVPARKIAPALGFGNAVVWNPAEASTGTAVRLTAALADAGPPAGLLNVVTGSGAALSPALTGGPRRGAVAFTGPGRVGTSLREAVADRNVKVQPEMGGKNPLVVLADADLADAAERIVSASMFSTGQRCTATSRVYVEAAVEGELRKLLIERIRALVVGDPRDEATDVGPLASRAQYEKFHHYLQLAEAEGAEIIAGGRTGTERSGYFVSPTLLAGVADDSPLMHEEISGPLAVLQPVAGTEEALEKANDTAFGLAASVFTSNLGNTMAFLRRSRAEMVHVNRETTGVEPHVPFGGLKASSNTDREQGKAARAFFTNVKTAYIRSA